MIRRKLPLIVGLSFVATATLTAIVWFKCRIYVPEDKCAVLTRKIGRPLPPDRSIATEPGEKGIQEHTLGPGRHFFYDPFRWDWELVDLTVIPPGDPSTWKWVHSLRPDQLDQVRAGTFSFRGDLPQIGVVTRKVGKKPADGRVIVDRDSGEQGILREVLTPGTYKINPIVYAVELHPATVIPAGFVGVVTNLFGDTPVTNFEAVVAPPSVDPGDQPQEQFVPYVRPLAKPGERGTMKDVLQPGVYFINPKLQKIVLVEIGFNEYSQIKVSETENLRITFPSDTGYNIKVGVTVVWGIHPEHAASTINEFGNVDGVLDKVIGPQLRSICRNIGSTFAARDFIQGEKREQFQEELTDELKRVCGGKNVEILLALVREIEVHAPDVSASAGETTEDLKRTIQESYIAIERQITQSDQRVAAEVKAALEEERKKIDIARETVQADTRKMVARIQADARKTAAQIDADAKLEVARVQEEVAKLDAQRIEILGQANAAVEKLKQGAEAQGYKMLIDAFGSAEAYNLYTFAQNFKPESIRLFFAGEGTFWTDLSRFEEVGAARLLKPPAGNPDGK